MSTFETISIDTVASWSKEVLLKEVERNLTFMAYVESRRKERGGKDIGKMEKRYQKARFNMTQVLAGIDNYEFLVEIRGKIASPKNRIGAAFAGLNGKEKTFIRRELRNAINKMTGLSGEKANAAAIASTNRGVGQQSRGVSRPVSASQRGTASRSGRKKPGKKKNEKLKDHASYTFEKTFSIKFPKDTEFAKRSGLPTTYSAIKGFIGISLVMEAKVMFKLAGSGAKIGVAFEGDWEPKVGAEVEKSLMKLAPNIKSFRGGKGLDFSFGGSFGKLFKDKIDFSIETKASFVNPVVVTAKTASIPVFSFHALDEKWEGEIELAFKVQIIPDYVGMALRSGTTWLGKKAAQFSLRALSSFSQTNVMAYTTLGAYTTALSIGGMAAGAVALSLAWLGSVSLDVKKKRADANFARGFSTTLVNLIYNARSQNMERFYVDMNISNVKKYRERDWAGDLERYSKSALYNNASKNKIAFDEMYQLGISAAYESVFSFVENFGFGQWKHAAAKLEETVVAKGWKMRRGET